MNRGFLNSFYPLLLKLEDKNCLVVGGGRVALRKVNILLSAASSVLVVSPALIPELESQAARGKINYMQEYYHPDHLKGVFLAVGATGDEKTNSRIAEDCHSRNIPVNIVDNPSQCSFFFPSVARQGPLSISISTGGKSPAFARLLREKLERQMEKEWGEFLFYLGELRPLILQKVMDHSIRKKLFLKLAGEDFFHQFRVLTSHELDQELRKILDEHRTSADVEPSEK
jgi:precorrin-2 dehydrogenase/sirohydrochlorin ferrochelatase